MMMRGNYYNPSSLHGKGVLADRILTGARQSLASILKVDEREIYFTSGGSEGNNTALFGVAEINRKKREKDTDFPGGASLGFGISQSLSQSWF